MRDVIAPGMLPRAYHGTSLDHFIPHSERIYLRPNFWSDDEDGRAALLFVVAPQVSKQITDRRSRARARA